MRTKNRLALVIITKAPITSYAPLNTLCNAVINKDGKLITAHRVNGGSGTYFTKHESNQLEFIEVQS